ncbi:MAG: hypothetical protein PHW07_04005 [Sulfurospirillaceae bacterium]|nr:hypothetical protein [Sulfurospirillaceae bacterium]
MINIQKKDLHLIDKLGQIIAFIRPTKLNNIESSLESIDILIKFFNEKNKLAQDISDEINLLFIDSKISANITNFGILSNNDFGYELRERFYNKFLPNPPQKGDLTYIFSTLFNKKDDSIWVSKIDNKKWIEFFSSLFGNSKKIVSTKNHLFSELLYAIEILSIWIASEEFDSNFIRLDKSLLNKDSAFIALQRNIAVYINTIQSDSIPIEKTRLDFDHLKVFIEQCYGQVNILRKKSLNQGISINLTYQLERLTQTIKRLEDILDLIQYFDTNESNLAFVELFKEAVVKNETKNSLSELYAQGIQIVARSITNNASEHGEHYIIKDMSGYFKMFLSASGAGIIIAFMALLKIYITQEQFSLGIQTVFTSLNYGLGFVFIHLLGFTVATKQPAMTASSFAEAIEKEEGKRTANKKRLVELIFQVSRSQFAAVIGNVTLALLVASIIAFLTLGNNDNILTNKEAIYYLEGLKPFEALFFAGIAGIWLFISGLISGYFDNRADLLELKQRYFHQPLLKKLLDDKKREKFASYLHGHHGAIAGNFFFGVLLGITPYVGYLFDLPLDIAHIAFSSAYLGYASVHLDISFSTFLCYLGYTLMIGAINLIVSFSLALKVSLLSRDTSFGNLFSFLKVLILEILKRPHHLVLPFGYGQKKIETKSNE